MPWWNPFVNSTERELKEIKKQLKKIMATEQELIADLKAIKTQQEKTVDEIKGVQGAVDTLKAKVIELEATIASGSPSQELVDAVAAVKAQAQVVDDQIPDTTP